MSTTSDRNSVSSGKKKVLVIAHPELANAIYEALDPLIELSDRADPSSEDATVAWLCDRIFPSPLRKKTAFFMRAWSKMRTLGRNQRPTLLADSSLFGWGGYEFVIIQDLWPVRSSSGNTLECAGYVLAGLDYYLWGNFSTKKIILVSDKTFPPRKAELIREGLLLPPATDVDDVVSEFDRKQAFATIDLGGDGDFRQRLVRVLEGGKNSLNLAAQKQAVGTAATYVRGHEDTEEIADHLSKPVLEEVLRALQTYVGQQAEVIVVDDELQDLNQTFKQLTGKPLNSQPNQSLNQVNVTRTSDGIVQQAETFDGLVDLCTREFDKAIRGSKPYTLLVTDILFRGSSWNKTGLDLIDTLRVSLKQQAKARHIGIVAYTAFTTPFIAMSSHQRGADFVVAKTVLGSHDIKLTGSQRLMMTLAFLCFQKSFLSERRKDAESIMKETKSAESVGRTQTILRQLQAVLPKHTVSPHLQQEWLDTCYLFEALSLYEPESEQLQEVYQEMSRKYD